MIRMDGANDKTVKTRSICKLADKLLLPAFDVILNWKASGSSGSLTPAVPLPPISSAWESDLTFGAAFTIVSEKKVNMHSTITRDIPLPTIENNLLCVLIIPTFSLFFIIFLF